MLKKCDGRTNGRTNERTNEQTDLCIELRYAQLIKYTFFFPFFTESLINCARYLKI